ncbi:hypothetical protein J7L05_08325 [bacterium]|nr:hypothetical protein [bacterium]
MNKPDEAFQVFETLKLTFIIAIPVCILAAIIFYFNNKAQKEASVGGVDVDAMRKEMENLAEEKKAQRIQEPEVEEKPKLEAKEIRREIESKREDFEEFELVTPLIDLADEDEIENEGETHEL